MALAKCGNCGELVSSASRACGACGTANPRYNLPRLAIVYVILFAVFSSAFLTVLLAKKKEPVPGYRPYSPPGELAQ